MSSTTKCHICALTLRIPVLQHSESAFCPRCNARLTKNDFFRHQKVIALSISAILALILASIFPFLSINANGLSNEIHFTDTFQSLFVHEFSILAFFLFLTIWALPLTVLFCNLYLFIPLYFSKKPLPYSHEALKLLFLILPWIMAEIFLVGVLVSFVKLIELADLEMGIAFFSFIFFALCLFLATTYLDRHQLEIELAIPKKSPSSISSTSNKKQQYTWALLLTAGLFYIPASILPIMSTTTLGSETPSTIMGGVITLWHHGSYPIALIIFIASVLVPLAKIFILVWLNYSIHHQQSSYQKQRTILYRMTEAIGRWSMIDVFVVALLVSLVQFGNTMSIYPGYAALSFSMVVIITMVAAMSFDSHQIWQPVSHD